MAIADYLTRLDSLRDQLANNLVEKGVSATQDESLTELIPKVLEIAQGGDGGGTDEFFSILKQSTFCVGPAIYSSVGYHHCSLSTSSDTNKMLPYGNEYISVEAYFNCENADGSGYLFCIGSASTRSVFSITPSKFVGYSDDHVFKEQNPGVHHLVVTYDKLTTLHVYVDGVLKETISLGGTLNIGHTYLNIGSWLNTNYESFIGTIYFVRVYKNVLLTNEQVKVLYDNRDLLKP